MAELTRQERNRIMLWGGNARPVCTNIHRMSVHCLRECASGWFEVSLHERGTSVDGSLSGCPGGREATAYGNAQVFSLSGLGSQS